MPDFVVVGHVCQDLLPTGGLNLGGSVSYAATTARNLGYRVGIVTSAGPDMDLDAALPGAEIRCDRAAETTLFENIYHNGRRTQILHGQANLLTCHQIPLAWRSAPMAYVGSIDQEIDDSVFHCFAPEVKTGVMPQLGRAVTLLL
jgi:1D-myo-inositol 3-kinase